MSEQQGKTSVTATIAGAGSVTVEVEAEQTVLNVLVAAAKVLGVATEAANRLRPVVDGSAAKLTDVVPPQTQRVTGAPAAVNG